VLPDSTTDSAGDGEHAPRRSYRTPAPNVTWWKRNPKVDAAAGLTVGGTSDWDLTKPPANAKEARARSDWTLWKATEKEKDLAHKKLGTWSNTKGNNKRKAARTRYVYDLKHDAKGNVMRYKARLVAQGFNEVPSWDIDEAWAPVPSSPTTRALLAVAAAEDWDINHVHVKTAFRNAKMDKEM